MPGEPSAAASRARRLTWIGLLALGSGLPFGVFKELLPVWLRVDGVPLTAIGGMSALALPWTLKVLWSPLVDCTGHRRAWVAASLLSASACLGGAALVGTGSLVPLSALLAGFTIAAATQDIAVDAYTIGILRQGEEGPANSIRVAAYRAALWLAGGVAVALAGLFSFRPVVGLASALLALLGMNALRAPASDVGASGAPPRVARGLAAWLRRPGGAALFAMVLFYKWPDAALGPMVRTFWVDHGIGPVRIGMILSPATLGATVAGAVLGGLIVGRIGILRALFWFGWIQALTNLAYAAVDRAGGGLPAVAAAATVESLGGGLATAAFLSLLMRVCEKERAAVEFALLSALFAATRDLTGAASGAGVAMLGYAGWFAITAGLALPGLALCFSRSLASRVGERVPFAGARRPSVPYSQR